MPYGMPYGLVSGELSDPTVSDVRIAGHSALDPNQSLLPGHPHAYPNAGDMTSLPPSNTPTNLPQAPPQTTNSNNGSHHSLAGTSSGSAPSSINNAQSIGVPSSLPSASAGNSADDGSFYQMQMQNPVSYQCDQVVRKRKRDLATAGDSLPDWSSYTTDPTASIVYEPEGRPIYTNVGGISMSENAPPVKQPYNSSYSTYLDQSHAPWGPPTPNAGNNTSQATSNSSGSYHPNFAGDQLQATSVSVPSTVPNVHPQTTVGYQALSSDHPQMYDPQQQANHTLLTGLPPMSSFRPAQPLLPNCGYPPSDNPTPPVSSPGWNRPVSGQTQLPMPVQSPANMTPNTYPPSAESTHLHSLVRSLGFVLSGLS